MTKPLKQRIRDAMEFDLRMGEAVRIKQDAGREASSLHVTLRFVFAGARHQHAELTRDWLPLIVEMAAKFERLKSLVDDDHFKSVSDSEEIEYWVEDAQVQFICDEALASLERLLEQKERKS